MKLRPLFAICGMALGLAGCMPAAPQVELSLLTSLIITDVTVEASGVNDGDSELDVIKASGRDPSLPESGEYLQTDEGRKRLNERVSAMIRTEFRRVAEERLKGGVKARLVVKVNRFDVPSAIRRILAGGNPTAVAVVTLVEQSTGRVIVTSPELRGFVPAGQGVIQVAVESMAMASQMARPANIRVSEAMAKAYFDWLLQNR